MKRPSDKISFVVPCYNSALTVGRCIDSILSQTYLNIELILIDDGSFDSTIDIIESYAKIDSRIKLIKQKHGGPNMAREIGIKKASGKYMMFVDSDDYIARDTVDILLKTIEEHEVDSIRFNGSYSDDGRLIQPILSGDEKYKIIYKDEIIKLLLKTHSLSSICLQFFKTNKIKKIKSFHSDRSFGEDFLVNLELHRNTERLLILGGKPLYYYCNNPNSTTRSIEKEKILSNISDRIYISNKAINYAFNNIKDINLRYSILYSQIKMIKESIMNVGKIKNYTKKQFVMDMGKILGKDSFININQEEMKQYMKTMRLFERVKNHKIIFAILYLDYDYIWRYSIVYNIRRRLKR